MVMMMQGDRRSVGNLKGVQKNHKKRKKIKYSKIITRMGLAQDRG